MNPYLSLCSEGEWAVSGCDIMNPFYLYAQRESGLSLAAVYKESFMHEVMYV